MLLLVPCATAIDLLSPPPLPELRRLPMLLDRDRTLLSRDARDRGLLERLWGVGERLDEHVIAPCGAAGARVASAERTGG